MSRAGGRNSYIPNRPKDEVEGGDIGFKKCCMCNDKLTQTIFCDKCYDMLQNEQQNYARPELRCEHPEECDIPSMCENCPDPRP